MLQRLHCLIFNIVDFFAPLMGALGETEYSKHYIELYCVLFKLFIDYLGLTTLDWIHF